MVTADGRFGVNNIRVDIEVICRLVISRSEKEVPMLLVVTGKLMNTKIGPTDTVDPTP